MSRQSRLRFVSSAVVIAGLGLSWTDPLHAKPARAVQEFTEPVVDVDIIGDVDGGEHAPRKALQDTIWIATWDFEGGSPCDLSGWEKIDNRILNDGVLYWDLDAAFDGTGAISGTAAALGYENDVCCEDLNGYGNDWFQAIRIEYSGAADISLDYAIDSEAGFDFLTVEEDSACASFDRVDYSVDPRSSAARFREVVFAADDFGTGSVTAQALTDYGPGTHCVYIAFFSDGAFSPCDGLQPTTIGKAIVVDNIVVNDGGGTRTEDFEDQSLDIGTFVNIQESEPFGPPVSPYDGSWARAFQHVTDNDLCSENTSCSVIWTDDFTPTIANDPSMAFAPGGFVVKNWLDDIIISPWVSLASTPTATGTIIQMRRFPGNFFSTSRIVQNWSIRARSSVDDGMGSMTECVSGWGHSFQWNSLSLFSWITLTWEASADFDPTAADIQMRHRVSDWQHIVPLVSPPAIFRPGPGPYIDRTRLGRQILTGPVIDEGIDARSQAQDGFPTEIHPGVTPGAGEHHRPTTDRFGVAAFTRGTELGIGNSTPNIVTGDSITIQVEDVRGAGGVVRIELHGAVVRGVHAGLAPPPHSVGANGFFVVTADSVLNSAGTIVQDFYFVDLDDTYFVGGDVLQYFWLTEDALGGFTSNPVGLSGTPASVADAQSATNGMFEVSFLPSVNWSSNFIAAVNASNKVDPNSDPAFLDGSSQENCILYVNRINSRRRSGDINRTTFMYMLDRLGYWFDYDVYDHTGMGNTNNHLGGRATIQQAQGYNLIVYDAGNVGPGGTIMPDGSDLDSQKVDQAGWFRSWLAQASVSEAGFATLWVLGSNVLEERPTNTLYTTDMQVSLAGTDQGLNVNPDAVGQTSFTFDVGVGSNNVDFTTGAKASFSINGGCPVVRNYDALQSVGSGVDVYRYADPFSGVTGDAAIVMNSSPTGNWNTIFQSHPYFDTHNPFSTPADPMPPQSLEPEEDLLKTILDNVLPPPCISGVDPVDVGDPPRNAPPARTALHQNVPNPFNPTTRIHFDLARSGHVSLRVYDVAGRLVRALVDEKLEAARGIERVWDGLDTHGRRVSTGVYFYRLEAPGFAAQKKMLLLK